MTPEPVPLPAAAPAAVPVPHPDPVTAAAERGIRGRFPDAVVGAAVLGGRHPYLRIRADRIVEVCRYLKDEPTLRMDCCHLISGVDWPAKTPADGAGTIDVVYHLVSYTKRPDPAYRKSIAGPSGASGASSERGVPREKNDGFLVLKVSVPRDKPDVPSVMDIWAGADWHERETYDLLGVIFTGRGRLTRILLPEDWPGHPLRKDWEFPADYHGIPIIPPEGR